MSVHAALCLGPGRVEKDVPQRSASPTDEYESHLCPVLVAFFLVRDSDHDQDAHRGSLTRWGLQAWRTIAGIGQFEVAQVRAPGEVVERGYVTGRN